MSELVVGDVVTLKSGGPAMTVSGVGRNDRTQKLVASCKWFDKNELIKDDVFDVDLLEKVS